MAIGFEDTTDRGSKLLISQYQTSDNLKKYIESFTSVFQETMIANAYTQATRKLDNAYGDSLDKIGRTVGINRTIAGATALGLFGFYGNAVAEGFGIGTFYSYGDKQTSDLILSDYQFRNYIRARILVNTGGGKINDIIRYLELLLNKTLDIELTETQAAFNLRIHATLPISDKAIMAVAIKEVVPIGVGITAEDDAGNIVIP